MLVKWLGVIPRATLQKKDTTMKFGFEKEYFLYKKGVLAVVPKNSPFPIDECGYLVEARGDANTDPFKAAFLLLAEEHRLKKLVAKKGFKIKQESFNVITPEFQRDALRNYGKGVVPNERGNLLGLDFPIETEIVARAGLHIHFSNTREFKDKDGKSVGSCCEMMDMVKIIQAMDKAFATEITAARRIPGCYEMKAAHGGFEYRSLPADIDVCRVAEVLEKISAGKFEDEDEEDEE